MDANEGLGAVEKSGLSSVGDVDSLALSSMSRGLENAYKAWSAILKEMLTKQIAEFNKMLAEYQSIANGATTEKDAKIEHKEKKLTYIIAKK